MKIFFVRHGKDDDRYRGGWSNHDLAPIGHEQAKLLARHLRENNDDYQITQIISSDLQRALTTAEYISAELGLPVHKEPRLREINNGDLAGMLNTVAEEKYPGLYFSTLKMDESYPNGESPKTFHFRIQKWFNEICNRQNANGNALIVTHGGVINIIYHLVNNIEWSNKKQTYKASNCSIHVLDMEEKLFEVENRIVFLMDESIL